LGPGPIGLGTAPLVSGIEASSSGWSALAPRQGLSATVSRSGTLEVSLQGAGRARARGSLAPRSVSTAAHGPATALQVRSSYLAAGRLVQDMGLLSTSYQVTPGGLEQSFTVSRPPPGPGGDLVIDLGPAAGWAAGANGSSLVERRAGAAASLVYGGLRATDAQGKVLGSQLRALGGTAEIVVRGAGQAAYPVVIDPTWSSSPTATLTNSAGEYFGYSVAMSADGTTALVGAFGASASKGAAFVFHVSGAGSWASSSLPTATLSNSGGAANDTFGVSVALSADGTTALVGAGLVAPDREGAAYVFHVSDEGSWATSQAPTAVLTSGSSSNEYFGVSVALSADGTTALVGANFFSSAKGAAYVFHVSDEGSWATSSAPTAMLANSAGSADDMFGTSVALSADGTTALVGAHGVSSGAGAAYVFHVSDDGSWATSSAPTAILTNSAGSRGDGLGASVALSADGTTALIGADGAISGAGAAYVFHVTDDGSWAGSSAPTATLANSAGSSGDGFGASVALSADGTTALIGADSLSSYRGAAYVFHVSDEGSWATSSAPAATLTNSAGSVDDIFGGSVALSADGTAALIGAYGVSSGAGAAYVSHVTSEGSWASSSTPAATLANSGAENEQLGMSVALSADGTTALVGAPWASLDKGAAYLFHVTSEGSWATSSVPTATLANSAGSSNDYFGSSVALSADGTTALIGADGAS
jgi:predicted secreted protein